MCWLLFSDSSLMATEPARSNHGTPAVRETFNMHSSLIHAIVRYICIRRFIERGSLKPPVFLSRDKAFLLDGCQSMSMSNEYALSESNPIFQGHGNISIFVVIIIVILIVIINIINTCHKYLLLFWRDLLF